MTPELHPGPDPTLETRLRAALDAKAKPQGALGRLEPLAIQLGLLQRTLRPQITAPTILVFAADHAAAAAGASAFPSAITAAMVRAFLDGQAAINAVAKSVQADLLVIDAGVAADLPPHPALIHAKTAPGAADWSQGPAMTPPQLAQAQTRATALVDRLADAGTTLLALGDMGIGNTASAVLLAHKVAGIPLVATPGAGQDPPGLARKQALMQHAAARTPARLSPHDALLEYGGFEIAMLTAAILQGAQRRLCVVIDGVIVTAAALLAAALSPACLQACVFAHRSADPAHDAMLAHLAAHPLLDLGLRLGEGTGAALAIPLLRAAAHALSDMAALTDLTPPHV